MHEKLSTATTRGWGWSRGQEAGGRDHAVGAADMFRNRRQYCDWALGDLRLRLGP